MHTVHVPFMNSALSSQMLFAGKGIPLSVVSRCGDCHHDDAMHALFRDFLDGPYTDIVSMDSDQGWKAHDLLRLCQYDRDIVGVAIVKKQEKEAYGVQLKDEEIWTDRDGLVECHALGSGFLRIRRAVVQAVWDASEEYQSPVLGQTMRMMWQRENRHGRRWGADFNFCLAARDLGFRIYVDPAVSVDHVGRKVWSGSLADYWKRQ